MYTYEVIPDLCLLPGTRSVHLIPAKSTPQEHNSDSHCLLSFSTLHHEIVTSKLSHYVINDYSNTSFQVQSVPLDSKVIADYAIAVSHL